MIAPMNDCTFSVVPVTSSIEHHAAQHRGHGGQHREGQPHGLEVAASSRKITATDEQQADPQAAEAVCLERRHLPAQRPP